VAACPNEVFSPVTGTEESSLPGRAPESLYCSKLLPGRIDLSGPLGDGVVSCIGSLPLHSLLELVTRTKNPVRIGTADCGQCEMKAAFHNFQKKREGLEQLRLLKIPISPFTVQRGTEQDRKEAAKRYKACQAIQEGKSGFGRREFLLSLRRPASLGKRGQRPVEEIREPAKRLPVWTGALVTLFKSHHEGLTGNEEAPFFHRMEMAESCSGCGVCASLCPTGAMREIPTETRVQLEWTPARCSGCRLCEEACPEGAIRLSPGLPVRDLLEETRIILKTFHQHHCPECRQEYRSGSSDTPCPYCLKQKELLEDYSRILYAKTDKPVSEND
jgi:ferredoxin